MKTLILIMLTTSMSLTCTAQTITKEFVTVNILKKIKKSKKNFEPKPVKRNLQGIIELNELTGGVKIKPDRRKEFFLSPNSFRGRHGNYEGVGVDEKGNAYEFKFTDGFLKIETPRKITYYYFRKQA